MPDSPSDDERFCYYPWPCAACSQGLTPIDQLFRGIQTGSTLSNGSPEEIAASQIKHLQVWIGSCPHQAIQRLHLPALDQGSEHLVYFDQTASQVVKLTRPGLYGDSYYLEGGRIAQRNCSPLEYLIRLRLWEKLFHSAPQALGLTLSGQFVYIQPFISGDLPTQDEVDSFLLNGGLTPVRQQTKFGLETLALITLSAPLKASSQLIFVSGC